MFSKFRRVAGKVDEYQGDCHVREETSPWRVMNTEPHGVKKGDMRLGNGLVQKMSMKA
jgi:hypothetical protein